MSANLEDYLPAIFRQRRPRITAINSDDPENVLAPPDVARSDAPASVQPVIPVTDTATAPTDSTVAMVGQDSGGTGVTRARRVETDDKGRPIANIALSGDAQALDLNQRVHAYKPQASQGWWDKWGKQGVLGAVKGLRYGLGGAIGGALGGGIRGATNPEMADEQWKEEQIASSDSDVKRVMAGQQAKTKMVQEAANTELTNARIDQIKHPAAKPGHPVMTDSGWALLDPTTGNIKPVVDPKTGKQAQGKPTGAKTEWVHDEKGVAHKYENGKDTGQRDPGRDLVSVPGYGMMTPGAKFGADATAGNREQDRADKRTQAEIDNAAIETANARDEAEKQAVEAEMARTPSEIEETDALGTVHKRPNPARDRLITRSRQLADDIKGRVKKAIPSTKPSGRKYTVDPKFLQ